MSTVAN